MSLKVRSNMVRFFAAAIMAVVFLSALPVQVDAASFSGGSGTKADPYLVKTAQNLNDMKNNLSSHFKLAATIDAASLGEFEPIGRLGKPFTGSFVCDMGTDGYPLYAIKNLKVYNHQGEWFNHVLGEAGPDYYQDVDPVNHMSLWEAAMFGAIKGASLKNIYVLNANITSTVVGQHDGVWKGGGKIPIPCVNEMATAVLVGIATDSAITGCTVTGSVKSASNITGALAGQVINTEVSYCYSNTSVQSTGYWHNGGFIGWINSGSNVQYCAADGTLDANCFSAPVVSTGQWAGGFAGQTSSNASVSNCYTNVTNTKEALIAQGKDYYSSVSFSGFDPNETPSGERFTNCYTTTKIKGITRQQSGFNAGSAMGGRANNSYVIAESGAIQVTFEAATKANILNAFKGKSGWNTSGELPLLTDLKLLKNEGMFVAGQERAGAVPTSTASGAASQSGASGGTASVNSGTTSDIGNNTSTDVSDNTSQGDTASEVSNAGTASEVTGDSNVSGNDTSVNNASSERRMVFIILSVIVCVICVSALALLLQLALKYQKAIRNLKNS